MGARGRTIPLSDSHCQRQNGAEDPNPRSGRPPSGNPTTPTRSDARKDRALIDGNQRDRASGGSGTIDPSTASPSAVIDRNPATSGEPAAGNGRATGASLIEFEAAPNGDAPRERSVPSSSVATAPQRTGNDAELAPWRAEAERRNADVNAGRAPGGADSAAEPAEADDVASTPLDTESSAEPRPATTEWPERSALPDGWSTGTAGGDQEEAQTEPSHHEVEAEADDDRSVESGAEEESESESEAEGDDGTDSAVAAGEQTGRGRGSREERAAERSRRRQQVIAEGDEEGESKSGSVMPLVRHLNTVTKDLAQAHYTIGQVSAERDMYRRQVYQLQGLPTPEEESAAARAQSEREGRAKPEREARQEARAEAKEARAETKHARAEARQSEPELSPEEMAEKLHKMVWRRRAIALAGLGVLTIAYLVFDRQGYNWETFSRDSFAKIAIVGPLFQVFLIGFVFYRMARVGGRAGRWLFPAPDGSKKRRR